MLVPSTQKYIDEAVRTYTWTHIKDTDYRLVNMALWNQHCCYREAHLYLTYFQSSAEEDAKKKTSVFDSTYLISCLSSSFCSSASPCFNCASCSLGLVLPPYSEDYLQADLSDVILQLQCEYRTLDQTRSAKASCCCSVFSPP